MFDILIPVDRQKSTKYTKTKKLKKFKKSIDLDLNVWYISNATQKKQQKMIFEN